MRRPLRRSAAALVAAVAVASATLAGCSSSPGNYTFQAEMPSGLGLYPGSYVQILGLDAGAVTNVQNQGDHVLVTMRLPDNKVVPAGVTANVVAPELLGQRSVDLEPGYTGGPRLTPGTVIPLSRTSVPVETNTILHQVTDYLKQLDPTQVHNLVSNLSQDLNGQGAALNQLIGNAAQTIELLANKGDQLGQLNGSLAQLTGSLDSRTAKIQQLITDYDNVTGVIAQERTQLDGAIKALSDASTQLASFLSPNLSPIEKDVATLTTVGRTLDRNLGSVDTILTSTQSLFEAAKRAYDPAHLWINVNNVAPPGTTAQVASDLMRDRLAGICRRVLAHHSAGLNTDQINQLNQCGNPNSGYFNQLFGGLIGAANGSGGGTAPPPSSQQQQQQYQQGLGMIPGLSPQQQQQLVNPTPSPSSTGPAPSTPPPTSPSSLLPPLQPFHGTQSSSGGLFGLMTAGTTASARAVAHSFRTFWSWL